MQKYKNVVGDKIKAPSALGIDATILAPRERFNEEFLMISPIKEDAMSWQHKIGDLIRFKRNNFLNSTPHCSLDNCSLATPTAGDWNALVARLRFSISLIELRKVELY
jgi:hypothetical protein